MIINIQSKHNQIVKDTMKLYVSSYRKKVNKFIIEGFHNFEMATNRGVIDYIFTNKMLDNIPESIKQYIVSDEILCKLSKTVNPQGIIAVCNIMETELDLFENILYLDDIQDPGNMGTILRNAVAFNYINIVCSSNCVSIYNEKVLQSCQGAIFELNILKKDYNFLNKLKEDDYKIIATSLDDSVDIKNLKYIKKHILVMGNEANGISTQVLNLSDFKVKINISKIQSLNVGVATGIAMYELSSKGDKDE